MTESASPEAPYPPTVSKWRGAVEIMRFDKPIGTFLLLAPTLWGMVLANEGYPSLRLLAIFLAGAVIMRAAGCIANDLADRNLDGHVERTRLRPLVTGVLTVKEAFALLLLLLAVALGLVALTNPLTIKLSIAGATLAMVYPLMKRVTHWPQVVLGLAFSWSIPMAFAASTNSLPTALWWLFAANVLWTVVYDTQYAMVDREDDLSIGIKSTAILFGDLDVRVIGLLQLFCLIAFWQCGVAFDLGAPYYAAVVTVGIMFVRHLWLIRGRDVNQCFAAFNQSKWIGLLILLGLCGHFWLGGVAV
ncbi:MAG: 4-hydroxybenzoate octaprenyltransferase [Luminiphilus sp.]